MLPEIDIVLPCYNPPAGWQEAIIEFYGLISRTYRIRFIIVDDGSTSEKISSSPHVFGENFPLTVISLSKNRGKGFALREGVRVSRAPLILYTDIDLPFKFESMAGVMHKLTIGSCDIVAGYRDSAYYKDTMTWFRKTLSRSFRFFMKHILRISLHDTQCGLKGFNNKGKALFLETTIDRYLFDFEFIYAAVHDREVKLCTVGVELKKDIVFSKMRWNVLIRESINLFRVLTRSAARSVTGRKSRSQMPM
jgi:glycosyltransferase involved in cell wall biosynthesis